MCRRCKAEKSATAFSRDRSRKDGLFSYCRSCAKNYHEKYRDAANAKSRAVYASGPERREGAVAIQRAAYHADPEKYRAKRRASFHKRKRGEDDLSRYYREHVLRNDPCVYCGSYEDWAVDHIYPVSKGGSGSWDNLTRACNSCNFRKGTKSLLGFLLFLNNVKGGTILI